MHRQPPPSRRRILQIAGAGGLAAAVVTAGASSATASPARQPRTTVIDLGPAVVQFSLMSGLLIGDTLYIGSRNLEPARVIGFHVPSRKVVSRTDLPAGSTVSALAADPTGRFLYAGVLSKAKGKPNLFRWDLTSPNKPAEPLGKIGAEPNVRDLAVAPDGMVYAVGGNPGVPPALWEYDPSTGALVSLGVPDPKATLARAVAATETTVYFGAGSMLAGGGDTSKASLFAFDRAAKSFTSIVPEELEGDPSLRELAVVGDRLVIGTSGSGEPAKLAVMDQADPSSYTVVSAGGNMVKTMASDGEHVYFTDESGLHAYSMASKTVSRVEFDGPELGEVWGVDHRDGKLLVASAYGFVAEIDLAEGTSVVTDLAGAGAPVGPQLGMGIAAGGGYVYVGGTGAIARHDTRTGAVVNFAVPGEAKDADVVDGVLYTGQYNAQGIWAYDPTDGKPPQRVAKFASEQNRPLDTCWDPCNGLLLVGVQSDTEGGGSLWTYDPRTGRSAIHTNPVDERQLVRAVATREGVAYLGGDNMQDQGPRATVVAFDPVRGRELWRIDLPQSWGVAAMTVRDRHLYGLSRRGEFFVVDLRVRRVVHTADLKDISPGFAAMVTNRGTVYGVSATTLFRFDPRTFAVSTVVADINGGWYSGPHLNRDERGMLYTLRATNLVRIDDRVR
ncbi:PQQ-binding-like beta-propeller repeat protein [Streptomyces sp. VB1]|uniref:outer membrane protein assembly factor BamB family protein n=1 Tax=Streptomyces sp. VB1 TaxID=2986803 RepID=UPI00224193B4|nr:PQQ-binding-like beta-propeller repeat protein [Streptomyces sp. VB1]UZI32811.1 PQQ-binding-like beta-propeller repeat protein [Streptomyces sp. VB1]